MITSFFDYHAFDAAVLRLVVFVFQFCPWYQISYFQPSVIIVEFSTEREEFFKQWFSLVIFSYAHWFVSG